VIPAPFDYVVASSTDDAVALLVEHGDDAKLLAGGHSLLPMMKLRLAQPAVLIDIGAIRELSYIRVDGDMLAIGAMARHADLAASTLVHADAPLLAHSAGLVGDPQIRHRGTIGGSLSHADPAADLPMAVSALDATLVLLGPGGRREIGVDDFFVGFFDTALRADELLVEIRVPRRPSVGWGYEKFTRRANDWAIVGVATVAGRISLANMGSSPIRARASEQALAGGASVAEAAALADQDAAPGDDMHADVEYRRHLARVLTRRALTACDRCTSTKSSAPRTDSSPSTTTDTEPSSTK
jgi:carbon-monoxide dehydrogenase medium subunit